MCRCVLMISRNRGWSPGRRLASIHYSSKSKGKQLQGVTREDVSNQPLELLEVAFTCNDYDVLINSRRRWLRNRIYGPCITSLEMREGILFCGWVVEKGKIFSRVSVSKGGITPIVLLFSFISFKAKRLVQLLSNRHIILHAQRNVILTYCSCCSFIITAFTTHPDYLCKIDCSLPQLVSDDTFICPSLHLVCPLST